MELIGGHSKNSNWVLESRKGELFFVFFLFIAVTNAT